MAGKWAKIIIAILIMAFAATSMADDAPVVDGHDSDEAAEKTQQEDTIKELSASIAKLKDPKLSQLNVPKSADEWKKFVSTIQSAINEGHEEKAQLQQILNKVDPNRDVAKKDDEVNKTGLSDTKDEESNATPPPVPTNRSPSEAEKRRQAKEKLIEDAQIAQAKEMLADAEHRKKERQAAKNLPKPPEGGEKGGSGGGGSGGGRGSSIPAFPNINIEGSVTLPPQPADLSLSAVSSAVGSFARGALGIGADDDNGTASNFVSPPSVSVPTGPTRSAPIRKGQDPLRNLASLFAPQNKKDGVVGNVIPGRTTPPLEGVNGKPKGGGGAGSIEPNTFQGDSGVFDLPPLPPENANNRPMGVVNADDLAGGNAGVDTADPKVKQANPLDVPLFSAETWNQEMKLPGSSRRAEMERMANPPPPESPMYMVSGGGMVEVVCHVGNGSLVVFQGQCRKLMR